MDSFNMRLNNENWIVLRVTTSGSTILKNPPVVNNANGGNEDEELSV